MPPCARATVGQSWERSWPSSTKRYSVCLPSPDRELPSRGSLHSSSTRGSGLPISTLFSLVLYVAGILVVSLLCVDVQCRKHQHEGDKQTLFIRQRVNDDLLERDAAKHIPPIE